MASPDAEDEFNNNVGKFFRRLFRPIDDLLTSSLVDPVTQRLTNGREDRPRHEKIPEAVMDYYVKTYTKTGSCGGSNWYIQTHNSFVQCKDLDSIIKKPAMVVLAENDRALPPSMATKMPKFIPGLETNLVQGSGHRILWEKLEECNGYLKDFLARVDPVTTK